jgi:hypothetical protein
MWGLQRYRRLTRYVVVGQIGGGLTSTSTRTALTEPDAFVSAASSSAASTTHAGFPLSVRLFRYFF